jgi:hypothetical protein
VSDVKTGADALRDQIHRVSTEAYGAFFEAYAAWYRDRVAEGVPEAVLGGACVGAMLHVAAACAVGVGMDDAAFCAAADESYEAALRRAPRWG